MGVHGDVAEDVVEDVGLGVYSRESRLRSQVVVGNWRAASISKKAGPGMKPLTGVVLQPVRRSRRAETAERLGRRS
jgi:hypothetical protein